ncbi:putative glucuronoxylan glucuronosyltransferase f8h [Ranunculus cassubicifolius]
MVEFKRSSSKRGYYVEMKLLHSHGRSSNKTFCHKYFIWGVWVLVSLYFFSFYLQTSLPKPDNASHLKSRALLETATLVEKNTNSFNNMKIYIYDLPSNYNSDWLSNQRCSNHLFAAEVAIHKALMKSDVRTLDPLEADFFFVPVYLSCNFSTVNGFPSLSHARPLLASAVQLISSTMPFWNRSSGSDHLFVASHDFGACFHSVEELAIEDGIPDFMKKSIILQTFGVKYRHPCQAVENIVIPPYVSPLKVQSTLEKAPATGKKDIFAYFRGKMEVHPKNISGQFYSRGVRSTIWHKFSRNRKFRLKRERFDGYQSEIQRSTFCLCPLGWAPWSPRIVESVVLGCVPVIIADGIQLPFSETIRWSKFTLTVAEKDATKLGKILKHVAATNLSTIQKHLWEPANRRALLYNEDIQQGDATWNILRSLSEMLHKSYRTL